MTYKLMSLNLKELKENNKIIKSSKLLKIKQKQKY